MSDLTPEYLAIVRDAAGTMHGPLRTETIEYWPTHLDYAVITGTGQVVATADTLGQAETLRTLLQAVPRLLDEVERQRSTTTEWGIRDVTGSTDPVMDEAEARRLVYPGETVMSRTVTEWTEVET